MLRKSSGAYFASRYLIFVNLLSVMKRRWSDAFLAKPQSSHAKSAAFGRMAGDQAKRRTNVAFIACPADAQDFTVNRHRRNFMRAVHNAIEAGADIINISFSRAASTNATANIPSLLTELASVFDDAWISSVAQPAFFHRTVGSVMSFFRNSRVNLLTEAIVDPEAGSPAILLTFDAPEGRLCTITGSFPTLPRITRGRLLEFFTNFQMSSQLLSSQLLSLIPTLTPYASSVR